jgi:ATP-dependent protease ClpP protease subunit
MARYLAAVGACALAIAMWTSGCSDRPQERSSISVGEDLNATKETMGISGVEPIVDSGNANIIIATSAALSQPGTVASISLYIASSGVAGDAMMAIYDASGSGGAPGRLVAQTASFALGAGWNTRPVTAPVNLASGSYYLAFLSSSNTTGPVYARGTSNANFYRNVGAYGSVPSIFGTGIAQPGLAYSQYATLTTQGGTTTTETMGISGVEPIVDSGNANIIIATSAALSQPGTVDSISLYIASSGVAGDAMMAIYDASGSGGAPGRLVAQTASFALGAGWNTRPVTAPVNLASGSYYLAFLSSSNSTGPVYARGTSNANFYRNVGGYGSLPSLFGTGIPQPGLAYSQYATLTPQGGGGGGGNRYSTSFLLTENPISEGGHWMNGGTVALDWGDMLTTSAHDSISAFDTGPYADPTAILTGTWAPDQTAEGTVYAGTAPGAQWPEVEMRLRFSLSPHRAAGYEINYSVAGGQHAGYASIVRWNGPVNDFTYVPGGSCSGPQCSVTTGDVVKATIVGNVITAYKNGVQIAQATDSTYATGNPGMGVNGGSGNGRYGFSHYSAWDQ